MQRSFILLLILLLNPLSAQAWWNEDWAYRKQLTVDTTATGAALDKDLVNVPVLVRLHTGNFGYFLDIQPKGQDIRFVAGDDVTPLKYHIERFDAINEMALIWVLLPEIRANSKARSIWMYYGSATAVAAEDAAGSYGPEQIAKYHFDQEAVPAVDATSYANQISEFTAKPGATSLIGHGAGFDGQSHFVITDSPVLAINPEQGWTWSAWVKIDAEQPDAYLFERTSDSGSLALAVDGTAVYARFADSNGATIETPRNGQLVPGNWHHIALILSSERMSLFIDGSEAAYVETAMTPLQGAITVGNSVDLAHGFSGIIDELSIANVSRSAEWFKTINKTQGVASSLLVYGEDGARESGGEPSYFTITLKNVTLDGWVVIVMLVIMAAISWVVMVSKGMTIAQIRKDNEAFQEKFSQLSLSGLGDLDHEDSEDDKELRKSPLLMALAGDHEHFASSSTYRVYHAGVQEMQHRMPSNSAQAVGADVAHDLVLSHQAIDAIRATMDGVLTRENQKLNSQMVLLTIAISGGPFLGLLGTVVGVMITFAAIAASGDVNVNAIAPGIAAALVATVAGLAVAIPALFGYNYIGSRIKEVSADMHVFVDEFVTKIAEMHS